MRLRLELTAAAFAGAKFSVNDSEAARPAIEHHLWFHPPRLIGRLTGNLEVVPDLPENRKDGG